MTPIASSISSLPAAAAPAPSAPAAGVTGLPPFALWLGLDTAGAGAAAFDTLPALSAGADGGSADAAESADGALPPGADAAAAGDVLALDELGSMAAGTAPELAAPVTPAPMPAQLPVLAPAPAMPVLAQAAPLSGTAAGQPESADDSALHNHAQASGQAPARGPAAAPLSDALGAYGMAARTWSAAVPAADGGAARPVQPAPASAPGATAAAAPAAPTDSAAAPAPAFVLAMAAPAAVAAEAAPFKLAGSPPDWQQPLREALGERLQVQLGRHAEQAVIRLDPPQLGRIEIAIRHAGGALEVTLTASHPEVRRQLAAVSDAMRGDLAQRQYSEVSVTVTATARGAAPQFADQQGRQRHGPAQDDRAEQAGPGRALAEAGHPFAVFSLSSRESTV